MLLGNIVDKLHNKNRFTNTCTAEKTYLTALCIGGYKVNYLDTCFKYLGRSLLLGVFRGLAVDAPLLLTLGGGLIIYCLAKQVENSAKRAFSYGHGNTAAGIVCINASGHTVGRGHSDTSYDVVTYLRCYLEHNRFALIFNFYCVKQIGKSAAVKPYVNDGAYNLYNLSDSFHIRSFLSKSKRLSARHDFGNFARNNRLSCSVIFKHKCIYHFRCIFICRVHSRTP